MVLLHNERKTQNKHVKKFPTCEENFSLFLFPKVFGKLKNGQKKCPIFIFVNICWKMKKMFFCDHKKN